jgi:hypothetical protein
MFTLSRQSFQPHTIRQQQVVQRAVYAGEEHAYVQPVRLVGQFECGGIEASIGPTVIGGELLKYAFCHQFGPNSRASL